MHNSEMAQLHEVTRNRALGLVQSGNEVANANLRPPIREQMKNSKASRIGEALEKMRHCSVRLFGFPNIIPAKVCNKTLYYVAIWPNSQLHA